MSRSALSRAEVKQPPSHLNYPQPPLPGPPVGVPNMTMPMPNYYISAALQPVINQQTFVPLVGDDDDYKDPETLKNIVPMYGNTSNFNINVLLYNNIMESKYFHALYQLTTYHEVLHEICSNVVHVEPWQTGTTRIPSTAFCLLLKLFLMKLTQKQMNGMLDYKNNVFVRAIGFLYLRYVVPPTDLWKWYEPYLEDEEEIQPSSDKTINMNIGEYCIKLLTEMSYYGTTLPRIPVLTERKIRVLLLLLDQKKKRRNKNLKMFHDGQFQIGTQVKAIYSDDENEPAWYDAVITDRDESNDMKFWVKFPEYGNIECVDLGEMELPKTTTSNSNDTTVDRDTKVTKQHDDHHKDKDKNRYDDRDSRNREKSSYGRGSRSRSRSCDSRSRNKNYNNRRAGRHDSRSRSRSRSRSNSRHRNRRNDRNNDKDDGDYDNPSSTNLMEMVLENSRNASAAVGRNYGQRPASYKGKIMISIIDIFIIK